MCKVTNLWSHEIIATVGRVGDTRHKSGSSEKGASGRVEGRTRSSSKARIRKELVHAHSLWSPKREIWHGVKTPEIKCCQEHRRAKAWVVRTCG